MIKPVAQMADPEQCPKCFGDTERQFVPRHLFLSKTSVQHAEFNPGLGCVTKSREDRTEIAKRKGLVEVGNDFQSADSLQDKFNKDRAEKRAKSWEEI